MLKSFLLGASLLSPVALAADLSQILNARSEERELRLYGCTKGFVGEECKLTLETSGYGNVPYAIFQRMPDGKLVVAKAGRLDSAGKAEIKLKFQTPTATSFVAMLFDRNIPIAVDGVMIDVYPNRNQLGEQQVNSFAVVSNDEEEEDEEVYDPTPPYNGPLQQGE